MASIDVADPAQEEKIVQFVSVTGADNERALFYLQAAAWNLEVNCLVIIKFIFTHLPFIHNLSILIVCPECVL